MLLRRESVLGGLLTIALGPATACQCAAQSRQAPHTLGCVLAASDVTDVYPQGTSTAQVDGAASALLGSSGDREFDQALAVTLSRCVDLFNVLPGFAFINDDPAPNAFATKVVRLRRADGTILMGKKMLTNLLRSGEAPDACVAMVCAHEFGHILQFKTNLDLQLLRNQPTAKRVELQADFFAGYFAGVRKLEEPNFPAVVFATTALKFGDHFIHQFSHHGTPDQRAQAVIKGFEAAYRQRLSLSDAIQLSINYVTLQ